MCQELLIYVSSYYYICVLILVYMCPHTCIYVSASHTCIYMCQELLIYVSGATDTCVLILLYISPHTTIYVSGATDVSSYYYICLLILLYVSRATDICVLILLYMCPHTTIYVCPALRRPPKPRPAVVRTLGALAHVPEKAVRCCGGGRGRRVRA
jgi:hypothetical protein